MMALTWINTYRDDDEDDLVEYRTRAFSWFVESEIRQQKGRPPLDQEISEVFRKKRKLSVKKGETIEPPNFNSFGYSTGAHVRARSFYISTAIAIPRAVNEENYELRVPLTAGHHSAFEISLRHVGKGFVSPFSRG